MTVNGCIKDKVSQSGVAGATVELWYNNVMLSRIAADSGGCFSINSGSSGDKLIISSASYLPATFSLPASSTLLLERNVVEGEPVIVTSTKKVNITYVVFGLLGLLLLLSKKRG